MSFMMKLLLLGTKPQTPLELALSDFLKGKSTAEAFDDTFAGAQVYILVKNVDALSEKSNFSTLMLDGLNGNPVFAVFTHPDRAKGIMKRLPGWEHILEIKVKHLLEFTPEGIGFQINPGTLFSSELLPSGVSSLKGFISYALITSSSVKQSMQMK